MRTVGLRLHHFRQRTALCAADIFLAECGQKRIFVI
jgi:hypothetical protein